MSYMMACPVLFPFVLWLDERAASKPKTNDGHIISIITALCEKLHCGTALEGGRRGTQSANDRPEKQFGFGIQFIPGS
jgi:hypothetical protein